MTRSSDNREVTPKQARLLRWIGMTGMLIAPHWFYVLSRHATTSELWFFGAGMGALFAAGLYV